MCFGSNSSAGNSTTVNSGQKAQVAKSSAEETPAGARRKAQEESNQRKATILTSQQGVQTSRDSLGGKTLLGS